MTTLRDRLLERAATAPLLCSISVQDDFYSGGPNVGYLGTTAAGDPTRQVGIGPLGRVVFRNVTPPTAQAAGYAALQALNANVAMALTAGVGITLAAAPDGSGASVLTSDVPGRCVSLTSLANLSGINFTMTGYDIYGAKLTSTLAGPNANTVVFPKSVASVLSVVPNTTSASTCSVGTADRFGLSFFAATGGYVLANNWNQITGNSAAANGSNSLADDTGTFLRGDTTSPATALTGDVRGTYTPSSASDGLHQLIIMQHVDGTQAGPVGTRTAAIGVAQA